VSKSWTLNSLAAATVMESCEKMNFGLSMMCQTFISNQLNDSPNVAKVEDAADPRRRGWSCSHLPRALDNAGDAVSSAFPKGKQQAEKNIKQACHHEWCSP